MITTLRLALANLRHRALPTALSTLLFALGIAMIAALLLFTHQLQTRMHRDLDGIDLVVGAKGSPLQLILSSVYHIDVPTGNIPLADAQALAKHPLVAQAIPLALGDSVHGFRIVGTDMAYAEHYHAELVQGAPFTQSMQAVLGADAARVTGLNIGDRFAGSHGLTEGGEVHEASPYTVTGILKPSGSVLDRLVLTPVQSVWDVHAHHHDDDDDEAAAPAPEITALLIRYKTPAAAASLPRIVNKGSVMQAASPAMETVRLFSLLGVGVDALQALAALLIAASGISILAALLQAMEDRRYEVAMLRALGASRAKVLAQLLTEGLLIALAGAMLGLALAHGGAALAAQASPPLRALGLTGEVWLKEESWLLAAALAVGIAAALWPALRAYRLPVSHTLAG
jgi:putative ABC transport system permease protein